MIAPKCRISRARVVDAGRIITAGGITPGMEMGFHLLARAGYSKEFIAEVARVMEYSRGLELYGNDVEVMEPAAAGPASESRLRRPQTVTRCGSSGEKPESIVIS